GPGAALRLDQSGLGLLAFGDILENAAQARDPTILAAALAFLDFSDQVAPVACYQDLQNGPAEQFFPVVTQEIASCSIDVDNPGVKVDLVIPNWRLVVELAITLLGIPHGLLGLHSLGDVGDEGIKALGLARVIAEDIDHQLHGNQASILAAI